MPQAATEIAARTFDIWCDDCEELWETTAYAERDIQHCPHCLGLNVDAGREFESYEIERAERRTGC